MNVFLNRPKLLKNQRILRAHLKNPGFIMDGKVIFIILQSIIYEGAVKINRSTAVHKISEESQ